MNYSNLKTHMHSLHIIGSPVCVFTQIKRHSPLLSGLSTLLPSNINIKKNSVKIASKLKHFQLEMPLYSDDDLDYEINVTNIACWLCLSVFYFFKEKKGENFDGASYAILLYIVTLAYSNCYILMILYLISMVTL